MKRYLSVLLLALLLAVSAFAITVNHTSATTYYYVCYPAYLDSNHDGIPQSGERSGYWVEQYQYVYGWGQYVYVRSYHLATGPYPCNTVKSLAVLLT
jgi:hypothetical protein